MGELRKIEPGITRWIAPKAGFVSQRVSALWSATQTYGKPCDGALLQAWELVIRMEQLTELEISDGMEHFIRLGEAMPTPGKFAEWVVSQRTSKATAAALVAVSAQATAEEEERVQRMIEAHPERQAWKGEDWLRHIKAIFGMTVKETKMGAKVGKQADFADSAKEGLIRSQVAAMKARTE